MAKDKEKEKDAPPAEIPPADAPVPAAVPARRHVDVLIVDVEGYVKGVQTNLPVVRAEELAKAGKVKILGAESDKASKKAPAANAK